MALSTRVRTALGAAAAVVMLGAATLPLAAQANGTIRGRVTDATTQRPLSGAQVSITGVSRSAVTDAQGNYQLNAVPAGSHSVRAATLGYAASTRTVEVAASQTATANFSLQTSAIGLDALVVTGTPGATQKREIGNAVTSIEAAQVVDRAPITNVTQLLQARTPGLTLIPGSGAVGTNASIRIRGTGSLEAGNRPVIYVDGVRISSNRNTEYGVGGQRTSALDAINPEDIESIEVIKGPAAATLYGADAAAGVIQIITKRGKVGQQSLQWSIKAERGENEWTLDQPVNYTTCTAARVAAPASWPGCVGRPVGTVITQNPLAQDEPRALRVGQVGSYSATLRGGGERFSFYVGGDRDDEEGVFFNNNVERTAGRANFFVTPRDNLDVSLNLGYTTMVTRLPLADNASNGLLRNAYRGQPGSAVVFTDGYRGLGPEQSNYFDQPHYSRRFIAGTTANWQPWGWFRNRLTAGVDFKVNRQEEFYRKDVTGKQPYGPVAASGAIYIITPDTRNYTLDYAGTLSRDFSDALGADFSFGAQLTQATTQYISGDGEGLTTNQNNLLASAAVTRASEGFSEQVQLGVFAQQQIDWNNRLFLTGAVRVDDNSAFGENFSTVIYPKASASYVISDEPFFNVPFVDQFRLRAAWGRAGNAPEPFSADQTFAAVPLTLEGSSIPAVLPDEFGNPDLRAETGEEIELGFETALFGDRANLDFTYYNKRTYDALIRVNAPPSGGFGNDPAGTVTTTLFNMGTISNAGIEALLSMTPIQRDNFSWEAQLGVSTNRNVLRSMGDRGESIDNIAAFAFTQRHIVGYPLAGYWATDVYYNPDGTVQRNAFTPAAGNVNARDSFYVGPSIPTREISLGNTLTLFRNLRLYAFADYKGGHYLWAAGAFVRCRTDQNCAEINDPNLSADDRAILLSGATAPYISKADFIKLRELSATYTLPTSLTRRFGADQASFSLAGRNLAVWTKYKWGPDPELNFSGDAAFSRADYMSVPMTRRWVATVNLTF